MSEEKKDMVNHPPHYEGSTSLECIECMELMLGTDGVVDFCLCNAFKYMWRYKNKNGAEDLNKAEWYLNWIESKVKSGYNIQVDREMPFYRMKSLHKSLEAYYKTK